MATKPLQVRVNIYLDDPDLKREIKIAAANEGVTLSAYCVEAIQQRLAREQSQTRPEAKPYTRAVAQAMDRLRGQIGPIGIPVRELIDEGRER
jgi:hypothetical protein